VQEIALSAELLSTNETALAQTYRLQEELLKVSDVEVVTDHVIHGGIYTRTIRLAPEIVLVGALIKIPTTLIVSGRTAVFTGAEWIELEGVHIIPARAGRKQTFVTRADTTIIMSFRTDAKTVAEAETEFTDEAEQLVSQRAGEHDTVTITGE
jgi:hypothetical protein